MFGVCLDPYTKFFTNPRALKCFLYFSPNFKFVFKSLINFKLVLNYKLWYLLSFLNMSNHFPPISIENSVLVIPTFSSYIKTQLVVNAQFYIPVFMQTGSCQFAVVLQCVLKLDCIKPPALFFCSKWCWLNGGFSFYHISLWGMSSLDVWRQSLLFRYPVHWDCRSHWIIWRTLLVHLLHKHGISLYFGVFFSNIL